MGQRETIVKNLVQLRDEATKLLSQLGHDASAAATRGVRIVRGRPPVSRALVVNKLREAPIRKRRTMSKAARAKISAAQKKRWAKVKAGK